MTSVDDHPFTNRLSSLQTKHEYHDCPGRLIAAPTPIHTSRSPKTANNLLRSLMPVEHTSGSFCVISEGSAYFDFTLAIRL